MAYIPKIGINLNIGINYLKITHCIDPNLHQATGVDAEDAVYNENMPRIGRLKAKSF